MLLFNIAKPSHISALPSAQNEKRDSETKEGSTSTKPKGQSQEKNDDEKQANEK